MSKIELDEKTRILLSIYIHDEKENMDFLHHYISLIANLQVTISDQLSNRKTILEKHEEYWEIHSYKFLLQTMSLKHLFEGTPLKAIKPDFQLIDLSSLYSLTRSLVESFLTINYLYYNHKTGDQATFRYLLYLLGGLNSRQTYPTISEENKIVQEAEKIEIEKIISEIQGNKYFQTLHKQKQNFLLTKRPAYEIGKEEIITESGLDKGVLHTMWRLYSNYSHSEQIEAMQLKEYLKNPQSYSKTIYGTFRQCFMLNSYQLLKTLERFPLAKELFNKQPLDFITIVEFYNSLFLGLKLDKPDNTTMV